MKKLVAILVMFMSILSSAQVADYDEWNFVTPDSLKIYVREPVSVSKDTVIVIHGGFGANLEYMQDAVKGLENKFHFVFYDQRGSLLSSPFADKRKLTFDKNVEDITQLMNELHISKAKILAHSMGSLVAMEFLKKHPEKVKNIVLVGAVRLVSEDNRFMDNERVKKQVGWLLNEREEVKNLLKPFEGLKPDARMANKIWKIRFTAVNTFNVAKNYNKIRGGGAYFSQNVANVMPGTVNWKYDYRPALTQNGKATIIFGDYDFQDFNGENHLKTLKDFPQISFKLIKNAGHNVWLDSPDIFKKELEDALTK